MRYEPGWVPIQAVGSVISIEVVERPYTRASGYFKDLLNWKSAG